MYHSTLEVGLIFHKALSKFRVGADDGFSQIRSLAFFLHFFPQDFNIVDLGLLFISGKKLGRSHQLDPNKPACNGHTQ